MALITSGCVPFRGVRDGPRGDELRPVDRQRQGGSHAEHRAAVAARRGDGNPDRERADRDAPGGPGGEKSMAYSCNPCV